MLWAKILKGTIDSILTIVLLILVIASCLWTCFYNQSATSPFCNESLLLSGYFEQPSYLFMATNKMHLKMG